MDEALIDSISNAWRGLGSLSSRPSLPTLETKLIMIIVLGRYWKNTPSHRDELMNRTKGRFT